MSDVNFEFKRQLIHGLVGTAIAVSVWLLKPVLGILTAAPLLLAASLLYALPKAAPGLNIHIF